MAQFYSEYDAKREIAKEIAKMEKELSSMKHNVTKDVSWERGVQDQFKSESVSWTEFSNPQMARELEDKIRQKKSELESYDYKEDQRKREEMNISIAKAKEERKDIFNIAKSKYDEKMNAYMSMNFWGKAKAIITKKKPAKMNNKQIMETYGDESIKEVMEPVLQEIEMRRQDEIINAEKLFNEIYTPEERKAAIAEGRTLESRIKQINFKWDREVERIKEKYSKEKDRITERGMGR